MHAWAAGARRHVQGEVLPPPWTCPLENVKVKFASITTFWFTQKEKIVASRQVSPTKNIPKCICDRAGEFASLPIFYSWVEGGYGMVEFNVPLDTL